MKKTICLKDICVNNQYKIELVMAFIFMMMVAGLLIRVVVILGMEASAKIDRYLAKEKVKEAPLFKMKVMHGKPIIKESLVKP